MELKEELDELWDLKLKIESQGFQKHIMKPLYEELDSLKPAYDCQTLRELATLKGKRQGLKQLIEILQQVDVDIRNKKDELETEEKI